MAGVYMIIAHDALDLTGQGPPDSEIWWPHWRAIQGAPAAIVNIWWLLKHIQLECFLVVRGTDRRLGAKNF